MLIHRQTVSLYHNTSMWQDTRDSSGLDRKPADFTTVSQITQELSSFIA